MDCTESFNVIRNLLYSISPNRKIEMKSIIAANRGLNMYNK